MSRNNVLLLLTVACMYFAGLLTGLNAAQKQRQESAGAFER